jgi:hypothetical protein
MTIRRSSAELGWSFTGSDRPELTSEQVNVLMELAAQTRYFRRILPSGLRGISARKSNTRGTL